MNFHESRKAKFEKGRLEYSTPWDLEHVDARAELKEEFEDVYNYGSLLGGVRGTLFKWVAKVGWYIV